MTRLQSSERSCPVCHNNCDHQPLNRYSDEPWHLLTCPDCAFTWLLNAPEYTQLEEHFAWEKTAQQETQRRTAERPIGKRVSNSFRLFRQKVLKRDKLMTLVREHIPHGRVLDVGCGDGGVLRRLVEQGNYTPVGIEISRAQAAAAAASLQAFGGSVVQASAVEGMQQIPPASLDGVLMSAFLEHESQPRALLQATREAMKPGACGIIKVPNYGSINRSVRGKKWCGFRFPDHVNYFAPHTLRNIVESSGFEVIQFGFFDRLPLSDNMWMVYRRPHTT